MSQHEIQVFHILPGRAYGYDLSFLALHLLRTSFRGAVLFSMNRLSFTDIITQYRDNYNNEGLEYRRSRLLASSIGNRFSGRKLSRWRVEIFRQRKARNTANPAQPENTTRP
jgi:hypothetical protein